MTTKLRYPLVFSAVLSLGATLLPTALADQREEGSASAVGRQPASELTSDSEPAIGGSFDRDANRSFVGKVILPMSSTGATTVPRARVTLLAADGTLHQGTTNIHGDFAIDGIAPGHYAMTARANGLFACYGVQIPASDGLASREAADIFCAMLTPARFEETVLPYLNLQATRPQELPEPAASSDPVGTMLATYQVRRTDSGLVGRLHAAEGVPAAEMNVFIFKKREPVARTISDRDGRFAVVDLPPGIYSLVTAGPSGVAALGFELVEGRSANANLNAAGTTFVNQAGDDSGSLDIDVVPLSADEIEEVVGVPEEDEDEDEEAVDLDDESIADADDVMVDEFGNPIEEVLPLDPFGYPMAGGGYAPGGGSYGGGGGGGGDFGSGGSLTGAGLLIGAAAAAVSSSDDNRLVPQITSPVIPAN